MPSVHLHPELHEAVKLYCAKQGITIQKFVDSAVNSALMNSDVGKGEISPETVRKVLNQVFSDNLDRLTSSFIQEFVDSNC